MVVFDIRTVHASTANVTDRFRISMDTRWQVSWFVTAAADVAAASFAFHSLLCRAIHSNLLCVWLIASIICTSEITKSISIVSCCSC
jgi:ectoine hydroxylase-related dioxygenase (phytanoyl-CoA dioxygenase family)